MSSMKAKLIDGKAVSAALREQLKSEVETLAEEGITPGLAVVIVGDDSASKVYVKNKEKACAELGIYSEKYELPAETTQEELLALVAKLNVKPDIDGILVQLPLPAHLDENSVIAAISPDKDVDAFSAANVGRIMLGDYKFLPCTPAGIMELLKEYNISIAGKRCVVLGRSNIVGKPMALLLMQNDGTVTTCHTKTEGMETYTREADILVSAAGHRGLVTGDMVKEGAVVIDVAMNRNEEGKFCGDVDFDAVEKKASYITPVPGGVGPMTRAILLKNMLTAAKRHLGVE